MAAHERSFSAADRQRFQQLKEELRRKLARTRADSEAIFQCSLIFLEVRDRRFHELDEAEECEPWMDDSFRVRPRQAGKYFHIGAHLTADEVRDKTQGVEVMYQISLADARLHLRMWELAERERLSDGALSAGRLAATRYLDKGQEARALRALVSAARKRAAADERERVERALRPKPTRCQLIEEGLARDMDRLERLLEDEVELSDAEVKLLGARLDGLIALRQRLPAPRSQAEPLSPARRPKASERAEDVRTAGQGRERAGGDLGASHPEILALIEGLESYQQEALGELLFLTVHGTEPADPDLQFGKLLALAQGYLEQAGGTPESIARWVGDLCQQDSEQRRLFALEFVVAAGLPAAAVKLHMLRHHPLPPRLKERVRELCRQVPLFSAAASPGAAATQVQ